MDSQKTRGQGLVLRFDPASRTLIASITPEADAEPIDEPWLRELLAEQGHGALHYLPDAATALLGKYNSGEAAELKLAEALDATLHVSLTANGLEARVEIGAAQGGTAVTREAIVAALAAEGVTSGLLDTTIAAVVAAGSTSGEIVARGTPAEDGADGRLEVLIPQARDRQPHEDMSGHIDYHDLGDIQVVHPGDALMRRHPPTPGVDGRTLLGQTIPAKPGKIVKFASKLPGTDFAGGDDNLLLAAVTGQPVIVKNGMAVEPIYKIKQVGSASGNVNFDGNVVISGDVDAGMTVCATGDIEVGGVVDLATLEAGGNIVVKGGVIGSLVHAGSGEHHVRCGGSFNATYAQQAVIEAGDSIFIDDMALQCELSALNHIAVGHKQRGHIIGGSAKAMLSITAKVIGSPSQGHTRLEIGVNPQMRAEQQALLHKRDERTTQLGELGKLLTFAGKTPGRLAPDVVDKARATAMALAREIGELNDACTTLEQKIELSQHARVVAEVALHEGSDVHLGRYHYRTTHEHGPCTIGLNEEGVFGPL